MAAFYDFAKIRSRLTEEVLDYLHQVAASAAEVPSYYPSHLRSIERSRNRFDEIRQTVQVVENREVFQRWLAEQRERQRAAGCSTESGAYSSRALRPGEPEPSGAPEDENTARLEFEEARPIPIPWDEQAGHRFRRAVILGDPGLGKTWLLRYEARRIARCSAALLEDAAIPLEEVELPIHLRVSDLSRLKGTIEDALIGLLGEGRSKSFRVFLRRQLECDRAVLFLDAWDEAGEREELRRRLEGFARRRPETRILLTSRIVGYEMPPFPGAEEVELLAFGRAEIEAFVSVWFADQTEQGNAFLQTLNQNHSVTGLAEIPLMLALMCRSWTGDAKKFPRRRVELYERCLMGLLRDWKQTKGKKTEDVVLEGVLRRLSRAAEHLFAAQKDQFTEADLASAMGFELSDHAQARQAQHIINALKTDGMLTASGSDLREFLFLHRTIHEYLAAQAIAERANTLGWQSVERFIDKRAWLPGWEQVIVLLAGQLEYPEPLFRLLVDKGDDYLRHRLMVAARCLVEVEKTRIGSWADRITEITFGLYLDFARRGIAPAAPNMHQTLQSLAQVNAHFEGAPLLDWITSSLFHSLPNKVANVEFQTLLAIGTMAGRHEVIRRLIQLSRHETCFCRCLAAEALAKVGRHTHMAEIRECLQELCADVEWRVQTTAAASLGRLLGGSGQSEGLEFLLRLSGGLADIGLEYFNKGLSEFGRPISSMSIADRLLEFAREGDPNDSSLRARVADALGYMRPASQPMTEYLLGLLDERSWFSRASGMAALLSFGIETPEMPVILTELFRQWAGGAVEDKAAKSFALLGRAAQRKVVDMLFGLLHKGDAIERERAVRVLVDLRIAEGRSEILDELANMLHGDALSYLPLLAITKMGSAAARSDIVQALVDLLDYTRDPSRTSAGMALSFFAAGAIKSMGPAAATPQLVDQLLRMVRSPHGAGAAAGAVGAVGILASIGDSITPELIREILRVLWKTNHDVAAVRALEAMKPEMLRPEETKWLLRRLGYADTRGAAALALSRISAKGGRIFVLPNGQPLIRTVADLASE